MLKRLNTLKITYNFIFMINWLYTILIWFKNFVCEVAKTSNLWNRSILKALIYFLNLISWILNQAYKKTRWALKKLLVLYLPSNEQNTDKGAERWGPYWIEYFRSFCWEISYVLQISLNFFYFKISKIPIVLPIKNMIYSLCFSLFILISTDKFFSCIGVVLGVNKKISLRFAFIISCHEGMNNRRGVRIFSHNLNLQFV